MFKSYLKITLRSLWKSKIFVAINVLGMGIALACCIVAYLNYDYNVSYDSQHKNAESIYRVNFIREFQGNVTKHGVAPLPIGNLITSNITGVDKVIRYLPNNGNIKINNELFNTGISYADEGFLDLFTFPLNEGTKADFKDHSKIFISTELSRRYFGEDEAVGQMITHVLDSGTREYVVAGVFEKMPANSSFQFDAVTHIDNFFKVRPNISENDWQQWSTLFIEVKDEKDLALVTNELQKYKEKQNLAREDFQVSEFYLDPFKGMAVRAEKQDVYDHWFRASLPGAAVLAPVIMSVLVLLIAIFNFTNTSIAMSSKRLKEIGIRKVMGGRKQQLIVQFLLESIILCLMSGVVAIVLAEILVPAYNQMWDFLELDLNYLSNAGFMTFLFCLLILTGILAGSYPAFYISGFEPTSILKGTFKFGGTSAFTRTLLTLQYALTLVALISSVAFIQNAKYQKEFDMGFNTNNIVFCQINGRMEYETLKNQLASNNNIIDISGTKHHLLSAGINRPVTYKELEREVEIYEVGEDYFDMLDIKLLEGRKFKKDSETDRSESVIVNQAFAREFGWASDVIDKQITLNDTVQLYVVGMVNDIYTNALWGPLEPGMFRLNNPDEYSRILVKANNKDLIVVNEYMEGKWKQVFPNRIYNSRYMNEEFAEAAMVNDNILELFIFLGVVAMLLSASGLFSMVSLNIIKKMKEIGVRKVLGASTVNIARNVNKQFIIILTIAAITGSVMSYFFIDSLMDSIWDFYTQANVLTFLVGIIVMVIVSILVVGYKIFSAATMSPVKTLRVD